MLALSILILSMFIQNQLYAEQCPNSGIICSISNYALRLDCEKNEKQNCNFNECIIQRFNYTKINSNIEIITHLADINEIVSLNSLSCMATELSCIHLYTKEKTCIHLKKFCDLYQQQILIRSYENDNRAFIKDICLINASNLLNFDCGASFSIGYNMVCDGMSDCSTGKDELYGLCEKEKCEFKCNNNQCTLNKYRCDGINQCIDGSDEIGCASTNKKQQCDSLKEFTCVSSVHSMVECIQVDKKCDSVRHCLDGSDEWPSTCLNQKCEENEFKCEWNGACISNNLKCDGIPDCADYSDEKFCTNTTENNDMANSTIDYDSLPENMDLNFNCAFKCNDSTCLFSYQVCNYVIDCPSGDDERICNFVHCDNEKESICGSDPKSICRTLPYDEYKCDCKIGYEFDEELKICKDINECEFGLCTHSCINTIGSYVCECDDGYVNIHDECHLANETDLHLSEIKILYSDQNRIFMHSYNNAHSKLLYQFKCASGICADILISDFDLSYRDNLIFFTEMNTNSIYAASLLTGETKILLNLSENFEIKSDKKQNTVFLAFDWIHRNIYFNANNSIYVMGPVDWYSNVNMRIQLLKNVYEPVSLIVSPIHKTIIWADWAFGTLESANLDGTNRKIILRDLDHPMSLNIDYLTNKIYWHDVDQNGISSCNLHGSNLFTIKYKEIPKKPFKMTSFGGSMYFIYENKIHKVNYTIRSNSKRVSKTEINRLVQIDNMNQIRLFNKLSQPPRETACNCDSCLCLNKGNYLESTFECFCNTSATAEDSQPAELIQPKKTNFNSKKVILLLLPSLIVISFGLILIPNFNRIRRIIQSYINRKKNKKLIYKCKFSRKCASDKEILKDDKSNVSRHCSSAVDEDFDNHISREVSTEINGS